MCFRCPHPSGQAAHFPPPVPLKSIEKQVYTWTSDVSNNTYMLNTEPSNATAAQKFCNDNGAHLVSWSVI